MPEANTRFLERVAISILRKFKTIIWLSIPPTRVLDPLIAFMSGRRRKDCYLTMLLLFRPRFRRLWKEIIAMSWEILTVTATIHSPTVLTWTKWTIKWSPTRALKLSKSQHCGPVNSWGATTTDRCPLYQVMKINFLEISNFNWAFGCVGREIVHWVKFTNFVMLNFIPIIFCDLLLFFGRNPHLWSSRWSPKLSQKIT